MGWASGEEIFHAVYDIVEPLIEELTEKKQVKIVETLIDIFEGHDADTLFDNVDPDSGILWTVYQKRYPEDAKWMLDHIDHSTPDEEDDELFDGGED